MALTISKRGAEMPASPIRKLVPFADAAKARGTHVFHLNIGQPDIETPKQILNAVAEAASNMKVLEYSHSAGNESLRKAQLKYYNQLNISLELKNVIITTGGSEAILFAMMALLDSGDEVIIPEPFYANYNGFCHTAGVKIVPITSHIENNFALPEISKIEEAITPKTKAIVICNPNNPTGYLYTKNEMLQLGALVKKHNLFLFSDEAYKEFCYDGQEFISALHLPDLDKNVVMFDTISKRYSACGGRIGALISRNDEVIQAAMKFAQARLSPPTFAQILAEAAVDLPIDYFDEVKAAYCKRRNTMIARLNAMKGVFCPNPKGAFYAIARLPIDDSNKFCQWLLEHFDHEGKTVMCAPATGFYATPGQGLNEVRLAYVINVNNLEQAMDCLEHALLVYPGKTN
jgi:aspartate aminotransferase